MTNITLEKRAFEIVQQLLWYDGSLQISHLSKSLHISKRSIYYDLDKVNEWLIANNIEALEAKGKQGLQFTPTQKKRVVDLLNNYPSSVAYVFTPSERDKIIICSILLKDRNLFIEDFMTLCQVSRNTIINDFKVASSILFEYGLSLVYENKKGYFIKGDIIRKRAVFFLHAHSIFKYYQNATLPLKNELLFHKILNKLYKIEAKLDSIYVPGTLYTLALFLSSQAMSDRVSFVESEASKICESKEYAFVLQYFPEVEKSEQIYLALHLLGSRLQSVPTTFMEQDNQNEVYVLAQGLVAEFMRMSCVEFDDVNSVEKAIYQHLKTSMYRYRYGVQLGNPMLDDIKNEYLTLFELTKKACGFLRQSLSLPIPDSEIAYITLHFGGFISQSSQSLQPLKILIVCPNGLSTGNMLKGEVRSLLPFAEKVDVISLTQYLQNHDFDVVISTVMINEERDLVVVHPILTDNNRVSILRKCMHHKKQHSIEITALFDLLKPLIKENSEKEVKDIVENYFYNIDVQGYQLPKNNLLGMSYYLKDANISFSNSQLDWKKALIKASTVLLDTKCITYSYIDKMIRLNEQLGPCMFICEGVVLGHAKVEDGALKLGLSLMVSHEPAKFDNDKYASLIFVLSAQDQTHHLQILQDLMTLFQNQHNVAKISAAQNSKEVLTIINDLLK